MAQDDPKHDVIPAGDEDRRVAGPSKRRVVVGADGTLRLPPDEVRRMGGAGAAGGVGDGALELEIARGPRGISLVAGDECLTKVYVELTTECNIACAMCPRNTWAEPGGTMSAGTFGRLIEQLADMPAPITVNFSGYGEPMGHERFWEFLAAAKSAGLEVEIVTNGLLLDEPAALRLVELGIDRVVVSIDGLSEATSAGLHAGSFPAVAANLRRLYHLRMMRGADRPELGIEFVATRRNVHELPRLKSLSQALGFSSILVTNLIPWSPELCDDVLYGRPGTLGRGGGPSPEIPRLDVPNFDAGSPASDAIERLRGAGTLLYSNGRCVSGQSPRCRFVTEGRLAVCWDGSVSPCLPLMHSHEYYFRRRPRQVRHFHLGNVNAAPLEAIWRSEAYRAFRSRVRQFDFSPCSDCGGCDLRETNQRDCSSEEFPSCGECLWAAGIVQCP